MPYSEPDVAPVAYGPQYAIDISIPMLVDSEQFPETTAAEARLSVGFSLQDFYGPVQPEGDNAFQEVLDYLAAMPALTGSTGPAVIQARKLYTAAGEVTVTEEPA